GFDLGVGILLQLAPEQERGRMMSLLSPWRDANEFWLLLGMGLFASAFPFAWGAVLGKLYGPLTFMVLGVVLRSVAFEFR
ncbi:cytochrome d ubiquinol oxidase subunit II, partial [Achromobacter xylosoxidans]